MNGLDISLSIFRSTSESAQSTNCKSTSTFADTATKLEKKREREMANKLFKQDLELGKPRAPACDLPSVNCVHVTLVVARDTEWTLEAESLVTQDGTGLSLYYPFQASLRERESMFSDGRVMERTGTEVRSIQMFTSLVHSGWHGRSNSEPDGLQSM